MKYPVIVTEKSENSKLGDIATTYTGFHTCPDSCPLKKSGACYGTTGYVGFLMRKLAKMQYVVRDSHVTTARREANLIRKIRRVTDIRLHTAGDCKSELAASIVAKASQEHMIKTGCKVYTYTHAWRDVPRDAWGAVSVLASCESLSQVKQAFERGYAASLVVEKHDTPKAHVVDGFKLIPCPNQLDKVENCKKCRLCMKDDVLRRAKAVVVFAAHGPTKKFSKMMEGVKNEG